MQFSTNLRLRSPVWVGTLPTGPRVHRRVFAVVVGDDHEETKQERGTMIDQQLWRDVWE